MRSAEPENPAPSAPVEQIDRDLASEFGVDENLVRVTFGRPSGNGDEREAVAAYATGEFAEAQRLFQRHATTAGDATTPKRKAILRASCFAGLAAHRRTQSAEALQIFREAAKLTDREQNPEQWAEVQFAIGSLLAQGGKPAAGATVLRDVIEVRSHELGAEHPYTLHARTALAAALARDTKAPDVELQLRDLLATNEKILGPSHHDALAAAFNLATVLARRGKIAEAKTLAQRAATGAHDAVPPNDPEAARYARFAKELEARPSATPSASPLRQIAITGPHGAIYAPAPAYPAQARYGRAQGTGVYELQLRPNGTVAGVEILTTARDALLDNAAMNTLRTWRFRPGAATTVRVPITFQLAGREQPVVQMR